MLVICAPCFSGRALPPHPGPLPQGEGERFRVLGTIAALAMRTCCLQGCLPTNPRAREGGLLCTNGAIKSVGHPNFVERKRQRTAALHDLAEMGCTTDVAKRRGVRLSSAAFDQTWDDAQF